MTAPYEDQPQRRSDAGVTLIEVMVAMLVFAVISTGIVASMTTITRMTVDNRARVTAANLASQDIDLVRAISDPSEVVAATSTTPTPVTVDGRVYSVKRSVSWISSTGSDVSCSTPTNPFYLRVNVRVTWNGMLTTTAAVQDDTILAPAGRISDSSLGSIGVAVTGATNDPQSGVTTTVAVNSGGRALTSQPAVTGPDGCTYANNVTPGNYDVTISKTGWLSSEQTSTATKTVAVTAGSTQSPAFPLYARAATFSTQYVPGPIAYAQTFALPTNLETTFTNTSGTWTTPAPAASAPLFPYTSGYGVMAGLYQSGSTTCASVDPQAWTADTAANLGPGTRATAVAAAGGTTTVSIPVGVVWVRAPANYTIGAIQGGNTFSSMPRCGITGSVYTWAAKSTGTWQALALPYGNWRLYYGTSTTSATAISAVNLQVKTNTLAGGVDSSGLVTLDPRPVKP